MNMTLEASERRHLAGLERLRGALRLPLARQAEVIFRHAILADAVDRPAAQRGFHAAWLQRQRDLDGVERGKRTVENELVLAGADAHPENAVGIARESGRGLGV